MAKANIAYHKRDLYSGVTTRILAELDKGTVDRGSVLPDPFHIGGATMNGAVMTFARYHARQAVKRELYAQGIKLASVESCEITRSANRYIVDHPEIVALATEQYWSFVKSGVLRAPKERRKPSQ
jgi:hypothetical protein